MRRPDKDNVGAKILFRTEKNGWLRVKLINKKLVLLALNMVSARIEKLLNKYSPGILLSKKAVVKYLDVTIIKRALSISCLVWRTWLILLGAWKK